MNLEKTGRLWLICIVLTGCAFLMFSGCTTSQPGARTGDTVTVYYSVSFPDGPVFDSNENGTPLEFTIGAGQMIPGFDEAVVAMKPGQTKTVTVPPEKAYGPYQPERVYTAWTSEALENMEERIANNEIRVLQYPGMEPVYVWERSDGSIVYLRFSNITDQTTTVDQNHPLAGKDLVFEITLVEIVSKA